MRLLISFATLTIVFGIGQPVLACSRRIPDALARMDGDWQEDFRLGFEAATGVYVVRVESAGPLPGGGEPLRLGCDQHLEPPFDDPRKRSAQERAQHAAEVRAYEAANGACEPERVRVRVVETLKGPRRSTWVETQSLIDVADGPPAEPVEGAGARAAYGAQVFANVPFFSCGSNPARRLSREAAYIVFDHESAGANVTPRRRIVAAYWANDRAPFRREVRRLSMARRTPTLFGVGMLLSLAVAAAAGLWVVRRR